MPTLTNARTAFAQARDRLVAGLPNLPPESFPWNEYEGYNGWQITGDTILALPDGWVALGWIDATKLKIRPRPGIAVKFFDGERDIWQHLLAGID